MREIYSFIFDLKERVLGTCGKQTLAVFLVSLLALSSGAYSQELRPPAQVTAGTAFAIASSGSGKGMFYLVGPAQVSKRKVALGGDIAVQPEEVERAGRYTAIFCSGECSSATFYVQAADPARLSFLVHPSRVPVAESNAMSAVAFVFDRFYNLVLSPQTVTFSVIPKTGPSISEGRRSEDGVAWIRMTSGRKEGPVKVSASLGKTDEIRVVQQIASEACNLRIRGDWVASKFFVETDPVRDCSGNNVPDGTIVSFTETDASGKTTVDVPIKQGIAKVEMPIAGEAHITVASGVVTGNEVNVAAR
jgi:hypothetical protein